METRELRCPLCCQAFLCNSEAECEAHIANCGAFRAEFGDGTPRSGLVSGFKEATSSASTPPPVAVSSLESACNAFTSMLLPIVPIVQKEGKQLDEAIDLIATLASALVEAPSGEDGEAAEFGPEEMWAVCFGPYLAGDRRGPALQAAVTPAVEAVRHASGEAAKAGDRTPIAELLARSLRAQTSPKDKLAPGLRVRLHGLTARPELNGAYGTLISWETGKGRYAVEVSGGDASKAAERLLLKPTNLEAAGSGSGTPSTTSAEGLAPLPGVKDADVPPVDLMPPPAEVVGGCPAEAVSGCPALPPEYGPVASSIHRKLLAALDPVAHLEVRNESSQHNVPRGSETHFKVVIVSPAFADVALLERHRRVNDALAEELSGGVHALSIVAKTPEQWVKAGGVVNPSPPCLGGSKR
jgi:BolA-like protein 1